MQRYEEFRGLSHITGGRKHAPEDNLIFISKHGNTVSLQYDLFLRSIVMMLTEIALFQLKPG
jgi:hypothetical protein